MRKGGACCKVLEQWDIVALADGTISGPSECVRGSGWVSASVRRSQ